MNFSSRCWTSPRRASRCSRRAGSSNSERQPLSLCVTKQPTLTDRRTREAGSGHERRPVGRQEMHRRSTSPSRVPAPDNTGRASHPHGVSEALALRWSHIDFDAATIAIRGTKTEASDGVVRLLPALARGAASASRPPGGARLRAGEARRAGLLRLPPGSPSASVGTFSARSTGPSACRARQGRAGDRRSSMTSGTRSPGCAFALGLSPVEVSRMLDTPTPR